jgi:hypothetical protein
MKIGALAGMAALLGIVIGFLGGQFLTQGNVFVERILGETPEARIAAYVRAVSSGDRTAALGAWQLPDSGDDARLNELARRREEETGRLMDMGIRDEYLILDRQWWSTCCEPNVSCEFRNAGGARMTVQLLDASGRPIAYVFDVFAREQPYWGDATGNPLRQWIIRDVYPEAEEPLYWPLVHEGQVRWLGQ